MSRKAYFSAVLVAASAAVLSAAETYDVRKFGAVGDKKAKDTAAFQAAVDACTKAGGGTVLAPPGVTTDQAPVMMLEKCRKTEPEPNR